MGPALFQNTSQVANYESGLAGDIFSVPNPAEIRLVFGHHVYETTLQFFRPHRQSFLTLTFLRDPIERIRSQFEFDTRLTRALGLPSPDESEFLARNANATCRFLIARFPTLAGTDGPLSTRALRVLSAFDYVRPHDSVGRAFREVTRRTGSLFCRPGATPRVNAGEGVARLATSNELLRRENVEDVALYASYTAASRAAPRAHNPLLQDTQRRELQMVACTPFDADRHIEHVAESLVQELVMTKGLPEVKQACSQRRGLEQRILRYGLARLDPTSA